MRCPDHQIIESIERTELFAGTLRHIAMPYSAKFELAAFMEYHGKDFLGFALEDSC